MKKYFSFALVLCSLAAFAIASYTISGKLSAGKKPIKDVDVALKKAPGGEAVNTTKTNDKGLFSFTGIQTGDYTLEISGIITDNDNTRIAGRTAIKEIGDQSNFTAKLTNKEENLIFESKLNNRGIFAFDGIPAGSWKLTIDYSF